jgi:hypothetical protein
MKLHLQLVYSEVLAQQLLVELHKVHNLFLHNQHQFHHHFEYHQYMSQVVQPLKQLHYQRKM